MGVKVGPGSAPKDLVALWYLTEFFSGNLVKIETYASGERDLWEAIVLLG